jgi:GntR family transcriptional regulator
VAPVLSIDLNSTVPAYRQIVGQIRRYCVEGALKPGDRLPSVRRLAVDLGVHHNTVAEAYRLLGQEGWLDVSQGRAVEVLARAGEPPAAGLADTFERRLREFLAEMRGRGLPRRSIAGRLRRLADEMEG